MASLFQNLFLSGLTLFSIFSAPTKIQADQGFLSPSIGQSTGVITRDNLPEQMQLIAANYYGRPFPHYNAIKVEHEGHEVL